MSCHYNAPDDDTDFNKIQNSFKGYLGHNDLQYWKDLEKKMVMVEQEILTLVEIYKDLDKMNLNKKKLVSN